MHSHYHGLNFYVFNSFVLILVVMEDALARSQKQPALGVLVCLNPCCNGRCTRTIKVENREAQN